MEDLLKKGRRRVDFEGSEYDITPEVQEVSPSTKKPL